MSLIKLFRAIDNSFIGEFVDKKLDIVKDTDPDRIYVENIRQFYNMPTFAAKFLCDIAVKENIFKKGVEIKCPGCNRVIKDVPSLNDIPVEIHCIVCEIEERENCNFKINEERNIRQYYKLIR